MIIFLAVGIVYQIIIKDLRRKGNMASSKKHRNRFWAETHKWPETIRLGCIVRKRPSGGQYQSSDGRKNIKKGG